MIKFLIGPALLGAAYLIGSIYGADVEQLVHKSPSVTYAGVEQALGNVRSSGTTFFDGGTPMPYELKVERVADQHLLVTLFFSGKQGAQADLTFTPQNDGSDTLITARLNSDRGVLRSALAGTSKARLAYAPDWMLNLSAGPVLQQLAGQIERGVTADIGLSSSNAQAQWEANLSNEERSAVAEWRQYEATRPAIDPSGN